VNTWALPDANLLVLIGKLNRVCIVERIDGGSCSTAIKVLCAPRWWQVGIKAGNLRNL